MNRATATAQAGFYITGGSLRRDAPCYVERSADAELYEALQQGGSAMCSRPGRWESRR